MSASASRFKFEHFPAEVRNRIYHYMLCEFGPPPAPADFPYNVPDLQFTPHSIGATILRTSRRIYNEAYDFMVKANRFIKVESVEGLPLCLLLNSYGVSVIVKTRKLVGQFKGYALAIRLSGEYFAQQPLHEQDVPYTHAQTLMILHRDLDRFCYAIANGDGYMLGFSRTLQLTITMAPCTLTTTQAIYGTPCFDTYFSNIVNQTDLLYPFPENLQGYTDIVINGPVNAALANEMLQTMARLKYTDPKVILEEFKSGDLTGRELMRFGFTNRACRVWHLALVRIRKVHNSSSWPSLVLAAEPAWVFQIARIWFELCLAMARSDLHKSTGRISSLLIQDALYAGTRAMGTGFWVEGYKYMADDQSKGWLYYHCAQFLRTRRVAKSVWDAEDFIESALRLLPQNHVLLQERTMVLGWKYLLQWEVCLREI